MKRILFILFVVFALIGTTWYYTKKPLNPTVIINNAIFTIELALSPAEIQKGLSGRNRLPPKHGMMFLFNHKEQYPFWMSNMKFPLDFIWFDGNRVVEITKDVPIMKDGTIPRITPSVPVDKVLEINAGEAETAGIQIGDTALFNK